MSDVCNRMPRPPGHEEAGTLVLSVLRVSGHRLSPLHTWHGSSRCRHSISLASQASCVHAVHVWVVMHRSCLLVQIQDYMRAVILKVRLLNANDKMAGSEGNKGRETRIICFNLDSSIEQVNSM